MKTSKENKSIYFNKKERLNLLLLVFLTIGMFIITFFRLEGYKFSVNVGDRAEEDIRASNEIIDIETTEKLKKEAGESVPLKYRISPSVQMDAKSDINNLFNTIKDIRETKEIEDDIESKNLELTLNQKIQKVKKSINIELENEEIQYLIEMEIVDLNNFNTTLIEVTNQVMGMGIKKEDLDYEIDSLNYIFESLNLNDIEKDIGENILSQLIKPNKFVDEEETEINRQEAIDSVEPVLIKQNEIIVHEGEVITEHKLELIKESGLLKNAQEQGIKSYIGSFILILISVWLIYLYINSFNPEILDDKRYTAVLLIIFITVLLSEVIYRISPYLIPISSATLLVSVLVEPQLAIAVNTILSIFLGYLLRLDISIVFMLMIGGSLGVVTFQEGKDRTSVFKNGLIIGISNMIVITAFNLIKQTSIKDIILINISVFLNGIIAVVFTVGSLPIWEKVFSILTPIKLGELANPNQPLMRRLLLEAPGTYHHSIMVGNLSEAGAEVVDGDPLLSRVGAYYHDIGKLERPYYFKENQFGMDNPHDKLTPKKSAEIILNHVTDGEKLARKHGLPEEIIDFILEHHGTTNVAYFYYLAKQEDDTVDIKDFTYSGRKPQSIETAVVMMADSVEAAVRSIENPTMDSIQDMMNKVIDGKVASGQFDECHITNKNITDIKDTFFGVLTGMYHDRVSYPEEDEKEKTEKELLEKGE